MKPKEMRWIIFSKNPSWNLFFAVQSSFQPLHSSFDPLQSPRSVTSLQSKANSPIPSDGRGKICSLKRGVLTFGCDLGFPGALCAFDNRHFLTKTHFQCCCEGNILNMSNKSLHHYFHLDLSLPVTDIYKSEVRLHLFPVFPPLLLYSCRLMHNTYKTLDFCGENKKLHLSILCSVSYSSCAKHAYAHMHTYTPHQGNEGPPE